MNKPTLTRAELANLYGIHVSTLARWIKKYKLAVDPCKKVLTPADLKIITDKLGPYQ